MNHKIYGEHTIKCKFNYFQEDDKFGFVVNNNCIYLLFNEIESIEYEKNFLKIMSNLQTITIRTI